MSGLATARTRGQGVPIPCQGAMRRLRSAVPHGREVAIMLGAYFAYMFTRKLVFDDIEVVAFANAARVISLEQSLGLFREPAWQAWAVGSGHAVVVFFNWAYIFTFLPVVLTTAVTTYVLDRQLYRFYRNVVLLSFVFALLAFMLFPLAPPRMMPGHFLDTIGILGPEFYASRESASFYNAFAAMPSLHFAWSAVLGVMFYRVGRRWLRVLGAGYPAVTFLAITITGNHYILDAVGGGVVTLASFGGVWMLRRYGPSLTWWIRTRVDEEGGDVEPARGHVPGAQEAPF